MAQEGSKLQAVTDLATNPQTPGLSTPFNAMNVKDGEKGEKHGHGHGHGHKHGHKPHLLKEIMSLVKTDLEDEQLGKDVRALLTQEKEEEEKEGREGMKGLHGEGGEHKMGGHGGEHHGKEGHKHEHGKEGEKGEKGEKGLKHEHGEKGEKGGKHEHGMVGEERLKHEHGGAHHGGEKKHIIGEIKELASQPISDVELGAAVRKLVEQFKEDEGEEHGHGHGHGHAHGQGHGQHGQGGKDKEGDKPAAVVLQTQ